MNMKQRCGNPNKPTYKYYGGRGIVVCERCQKFENFRSDIGRNYEPSNCRWALPKEQASNKQGYGVSI